MESSCPTLGQHLCKLILSRKADLAYARFIKKEREKIRTADNIEKYPVLPAVDETYVRVCANIECLEREIQALEFTYNKFCVNIEEYAGNKITKKQFKEYLRVQNEGKCNMFTAPLILSNSEQKAYIMKHYSELLCIYGDLEENK